LPLNHFVAFIDKVAYQYSLPAWAKPDIYTRKCKVTYPISIPTSFAASWCMELVLMLLTPYYETFIAQLSVGAHSNISRQEQCVMLHQLEGHPHQGRSKGNVGSEHNPTPHF
jgi:hypothetical protein